MHKLLPLAALAVVATFHLAPARADDLSDSTECSNYDSIDACVQDLQDQAREEGREQGYGAALDDAKQACSQIDNSDAEEQCEDAMDGL